LAELRIRHPHRSAEIVELLAEARLQTSVNAFEVLRPPNPDYHTLMSSLRVPVLIVLGDAPVLSIATARKLQTRSALVQVEVIEHAGHGLPYDQPERFAAALRDFLISVTTMKDFC
jgi:N-formylmaleamate deformylase